MKKFTAKIALEIVANGTSSLDAFDKITTALCSLSADEKTGIIDVRTSDSEYFFFDEVADVGTD